MSDPLSAQDHDPLRILFIQHAADLSGSTISGELVVRGFLHAGWQVDVAFSYAGDGVGLYEKLGCGIHIVPHKNWLRGGNIVQSLRRMTHEVRLSKEFTRLGRQVTPDVVYINTIVSLAAAVAAQRLRTPCVWHIRELFDDVGGEMRIPALFGKPLVRRVLRSCSDWIIVNSRAVRDNVLGSGPWDNARVIPNAVDERFFDLAASSGECRKLLKLPSSKLIIGVPGTLRPMKGHEFFFEAAALLARQGMDCLVVVTGEGEPNYVERLRECVSDAGLAAQVRFLGVVRNMPEFYRACDLVCIPSRAEPFGRTVIEAFASGTPVVASRVGGICETVDDGVTGVLVDYGDTDGLAKALARLAGDSSLREQLATAARRKAIRFYSVQAYREAINDVVWRTQRRIRQTDSQGICATPVAARSLPAN